MREWVLLFLVPLLRAAATTTAVENHAAMKQIEWIHSNGGFVSPKIELQRDTKDSSLGLFVTKDVARHETLMVIPRACLITSQGSQDTCDTARNLMKQRELRNESKFAPYIDYIYDPGLKGQVPSAWSDAGKELLQTILGKEIPPFHFSDISFQDDCEGSGDPLEEEAYLIVVQRSWDDAMIPVFDMMNHRNGKWRNVGFQNSHNENDNIEVFASRDVHAGEQLYLSFNECDDCDSSQTLLLSEMLRDNGFVEPYPRRWHFREDIVFELDYQHDNMSAKDELKLTWLSETPNIYDINVLRGHLLNLRSLGDNVMTKAQHVHSSYERNVSLEYYDALLTALEFAIWASEDDEECTGFPGSDPDICPSRQYDALEAIQQNVTFSEAICDHDQARRDQDDSSDYELIDETRSFHQTIEFQHSEELRDTCLYMNDYLHTCTSWRPHYHEVFVHYPARYLDEVKRVAFIGGGDSMLVHEILKYPAIELVLGLELDQTVIRSSLKILGTQPHFDDQRVQWWFGDASKSLLMLPQEYYGTFDLVLIDLAQDVVDILMVTEELDINDAAMLLLKPDGVVVRNEDWRFGTNNPFTKYAADIYYVDVPITCHQGVTIGSDKLNLIAKTPTDHHIQTVFLKPDKIEDRFDFWYNYQRSDMDANEPCLEEGMPADEAEILEAAPNSRGVLMIIEAEDAAVSLQSPSSVHASISKALENAGLTEVSIQESPKDGGYEIFFLLQEGYVMARVWQEHKYCAFDLLLWRNIEKQESAKVQLVAAVGSKSVSSYRIVTGGMFGVKGTTNNVGPRIHKPCDKHPLHDPIQPTMAKQSTMDAVLVESIALMLNSSVLVLCGERQSACNSLDVLTETQVGIEVIPVWTCPGLSVRSSNETFQSMKDCEKETLHTIKEWTNKIGGIVIDTAAPRSMGQILHSILANQRLRRNVLSEKHVVLALSSPPTDDSVWHRALLDRFRTDFARHDPAYRAEIAFHDSTSSLDLNLFSAGDARFYSNLMDVVGSIEFKTGMAGTVRNVKNGINNYVPDFEPTKTAAHDDYDYTASLVQWQSQHPLGEQSMLQFEASQPVSVSALKAALEVAVLFIMGNTGSDNDLHVHRIGDGSVLMGSWSNGSVVLTWDGRNHVSVNLFSFYTNGGNHHPPFAKHFAEQMDHLKLTSVDEMPRGTGRVVNFQKDIESSEAIPHWASSRKEDH